MTERFGFINAKTAVLYLFIVSHAKVVTFLENRTKLNLTISMMRTVPNFSMQ